MSRSAHSQTLNVLADGTLAGQHRRIRDYHWFTDVVAGWALAALIVMSLLRITGRGGNSRSQRSAVPDGPAAVGAK